MFKHIVFIDKSSTDLFLKVKYTWGIIMMHAFAEAAYPNAI